MALRLSTESIARRSAHRPWIVIGIWAVVLVVSVGLVGALLNDALTYEFKLSNDADSVVADRLIEERHSGPRKTNEIVIIRSDSLTVEDNTFKQKVEDTFRSIVGLGEDIVEGGVHYYLTGDESLVSEDRNTTIILITMAVDVRTAGDNIGEVQDVVLAAKEQREFEVLLTGQTTTGLDIQEISKKDAETGESIAIPIALLILVLVFGALVAAVIPIIIAAISIVIALGLVALVGLGYEFSLYVANFITMMGLAVGIDYSLFIVHRYREGRSRGLDKAEAIAHAGATANRAVFFSGMTVVLALSGLLLIPMNVFNSLAAGAIFVVSVSVLASLTLVPAVLSLLGDKINRLRVPIVGGAQEQFDQQRRGGFWDTVSRGVMKLPVISLVLAGGILVAVALPFFDMRTGYASVDSFPDNVDSKKGFIIVAQEFPDLLTNRVRVAIDGAIDDTLVRDAIEDLRARMDADENFGTTQLEVNGARNLAVVSAAVVGGDETSEVAISAIKRLRRIYVPESFTNVPADALVGGDTAFFIDFFKVNSDYAPIVFAFVLGMSFLLLMMVFRSIVVAFKVIVLNLLSVGATYGCLF